MAAASLLALVISLLAQQAACSGLFGDLLSRPAALLFAKKPSKPVSELVTPYGYPLEEIFVTTADDYKLGVYRMRHGKDGSATGQPRPAVLLQHGISYSCVSYLVNGPGKSLAFMLADAGFDVWLSNSRGNTFSRRHATLPVAGREFWAFSLDKMARYDLPAVFEHIRNATGQEKVAFVGHSEGATIFLAALSTQPQLQAAVSVGVLFGPISSMRNSKSLIRAARYLNDARWLLGSQGTAFVEDSVAAGARQLCRLAYPICVAILAGVTGYNTDNVDRKSFLEYLQTYPAGTSVMTYNHWMQLMSKGPHLSYYDYGTKCTHSFSKQPLECNQEMYNSTTPPQYDFSTITGTRLAIFSGGLDKLASQKDVEELKAHLPAGSVIYYEHIPSYGHLDFCWGADSPTVLNGKVIDLVRQHSASCSATEGGTSSPLPS